MSLKEELREAELLVYEGACPNCGGPISDERLSKGALCGSCLPEPRRALDFTKVYKELKDRGRLLKFKNVYKFLKEFSSLKEFFVRCVGNEPWSVQALWLKRVARDSSFAMIAPTGIGKTTFGLVVALYLAMHKMKSYIVVPTTTLAMQVEERLEELASRADVVVQPLVIHSRLKKRERVAREESLSDPESFDILVTTSNYLLRNPEKVLRHNFKFIFVDDVDAVLRGSKAINYILNLAGFSEGDIELGLRALRLKRELAYREGDEKLLRELEGLERRLNARRRKTRKILIIASATGNPRGLRAKLFRELMGFEIGARPEFIRNIVDVYEDVGPEGDMKAAVLKTVKELGKGGLVYVPIDKGIEYAESLAKYLKDNGVSAEALHSKKLSSIESFISGELSVLVGVATYYGVLVRGLDLPEIIRYAVFAGPPRHKIGLRLEEVRPQDVLRLLPIVRNAVKDAEVRRRLEASNARLRRLITRGGQGVIQALNEVISGTRGPQTRGEELFLETYKLVKELLKDEEVINSIKSDPNVAVVEEGGELFILIPDSATYIQASGRTSRLYLGGISKGISVVLVDEPRLLRGLEQRLKWIFDDFTFRRLADVDIEAVLREVDKDRELIRRIKAGEVPSEIGRGSPLQLKTALLVVESPNKARTIARFFGRPSMREYGKLRVYEASLGGYTLLITATQGHLYDVVTDITDDEVGHLHGVMMRDGRPPRFIPLYGTIKKCMECGSQFVTPAAINGKPVCPKCGSPNFTDKQEIVEALREVSLEVDEILVGTDPDTEGEKIAFDITNILTPYNSNIRRVEFHEVTRKAITNAVYNPRNIKKDLVKAQLIRRIEDRWLGFSLSLKLQTQFWKEFCRYVEEVGEGSALHRYVELCRKFRESYRNLSAGRVQTPVLGWIIDAYDRHVKSKTLFLILSLNSFRLEIPLPEPVRSEVKKKKVEEVIAEVKTEEVTEERVNPLPPYTTDAALYDINSKLRIGAQEAMQILQDLFELGFITYHRTDSTRVSEAGIGVAREYMKEVLGDESVNYFQPRTWGEGGAHECIRPTRPADAETLRNLIAEGVIEPVRRLRREHFLVYDLIFRRFIASQAKPALVKRVKGNVIVAVRTDGMTYGLDPQPFDTVAEIVFDGFTRFYRHIIPRKPPSEGVYRLREGFELREWYTHPLHTQASLVKEMREKEIGRPSTYAKIIDTLFKRKYVAHDRSARGGIVPLPLGRKVYEYLMRKYGELVSEERTRYLERRMTDVEEGKADYSDVLDELYEELNNAGLAGGGG